MLISLARTITRIFFIRDYTKGVVERVSYYFLLMKLCSEKFLMREYIKAIGEKVSIIFLVKIL